MEIGIVGLGRMGFNMALRLLGSGHRVVAHNRTPDKIDEAAARGAVGAPTLQDLAKLLAPPRRVWIMVPAGKPTQEIIDRLWPLLAPGDTIIDGGNSHYTDSLARARFLETKGISFLDAGTSGGIWGLEKGYCIMVGGPEKAFREIEPLLASLAPPGGYARVGPSGAGHFTKMVHNGIEYGMLEAYGEGFEILAASGYDLDMADLCRLWNRGSVVRSWLLELAESAFAADPRMESITGYVEDSGEGRWAVQEAIDRSVPAPAITIALQQRFRSRQQDSYAARVIAALRNEFGGHAVRKKE